MSNIWFLLSFCLIFLVSSCGEEERSQVDEIYESLSFYTSFDDAFKADFALGDPNLYIAPSWDERGEPEVFTNKGDYLQLHDGEGKYGDALWIDSQESPVFFYKGEKNMPYDREEWSGTVSFWMRLDPVEDLRPGYSDPIQITPHQWNDAAIFVDFTEENPRYFRFAIFADRNVWDPDKREWEEIPVEERPMVDVKEWPFSRNEWTHIALTFQNFNTGNNSGLVDCYINGEKIGVLQGREQTFSWNPEEVGIWLGYNYRGYFDELFIFDRYLSEEEIERIYSLKNGIHDILGNSNKTSEY